ncbi:hypothetical protein [Photobacterium damselae]|uniref:hypothetical protein n=1 Tax=Photobacterium damselae TaxID=38293 RepID=UPI00165EA46E|nr:hypothetical protein [Photobacterium damselae]
MYQTFIVKIEKDNKTIYSFGYATNKFKSKSCPTHLYGQSPLIRELVSNADNAIRKDLAMFDTDLEAKCFLDACMDAYKAAGYAIANAKRYVSNTESDLDTKRYKKDSLEWHNYETLYKKWISIGRISAYKFGKHLIENGYPKKSYTGLIKAFKQDDAMNNIVFEPLHDFSTLVPDLNRIF